MLNNENLILFFQKNEQMLFGFHMCLNLLHAEHLEVFILLLKFICKEKTKWICEFVNPISAVGHYTVHGNGNIFIVLDPKMGT